MDKKRIVVVAVLATAVFVGASALLLSKKTPPPVPAYTGPVQKLSVGNVEGYPNLALIAKEKGYFAAYGLDVSFSDYASAPLLVQDLLSGKIDMVSASAEFLVVRNSFTHSDLRMLATVSRQDEYWEIVARRDKNITNPSDLKGKTIAVQRGTVGEFLLGRFLVLNGMHMSDVTVVDVGLAERMKKIIAGEIDAVVILSPFTEQLKGELGETAISWSAQSGESIFSPSYTTQRSIEKDPKIVERYLRALVAAEAFVKGHDAEARTIVQRALRFSDADINALWPRFTFEVALTQGLLLTMEDQARWMIENKITDRTEVPNYLNFIYFDALESVKPEAVTIIH